MSHAAVLGAIMSNTPEPILRSFGAAEEHERALGRFVGGPTIAADRSSALLAQLAAYTWWQADWVDRQRLRKLGLELPECAMCLEPLPLRSARHAGEAIVCSSCAVQPSQAPPPGVGALSQEERWCARMQLSLVALRAAKAASEVVIGILGKCDLRQALWDPRNRYHVYHDICRNTMPLITMYIVCGTNLSVWGPPINI